MFCLSCHSGLNLGEGSLLWNGGTPFMSAWSSHRYYSSADNKAI